MNEQRPNSRQPMPDDHDFLPDYGNRIERVAGGELEEVCEVILLDVAMDQFHA